MRTVESTVYQYDELSERAKERARDWYRQGDDFSDFAGQSVVEDCARLLAIIGIDCHTKPVKLMNGATRMDPQVYYSGFYHQGSGASFVGSYAYRKGAVKALEAEAPSKADDKAHEGNNEINRIARDLAAIQKRYFYRVQANIRDTSRSFFLSVEVETNEGNALETSDEESVIQLMRDCAHWIYRQLELEHEYTTSDEVVADSIRANEYEFTEEGDRA